MKVILLKDVKGSGKAGAVVEVSDGFARNFLIPKGLAKVADAGALNDLKNKEAAKQHKIEVDKAEARALAAKLEGILVKIEVSHGADGRLYGSITSQHVADALQATSGIEIDKRKIVLDNPIKAYGKFEIPVKLYGSEIQGKINLIVTEK
ncbi:MAG: 50S ribosomal protein L9 [Clostridia bacterium]|nr:50S ribosomal protein L9 [Clostridia bacterium]